MTSAELTNWLIVIVIGIVGWIGKVMIDKMEKFEKKVEDILLNSVSQGKDIDHLNEKVSDHEVRISKLES